jgi:hypothetical protein
MRLVFTALCISAYASMVYAQTQPNLDRVSGSQPIHGSASSLTKTKGNLPRRVLPAHSPLVAAVRLPPVPRAELRQTCTLCPKVQRPAPIRSSALEGTVEKVGGRISPNAQAAVPRISG